LPTKTLRVPIFIVNFKAYVWGRKALELAEIVEEVAQESSAYLCVIPQIVDIPLIAKKTCLSVFAPHMNSLTPGRGTGHILPEAIKEAGAVGVFINHAEKKLLLIEISETIKRAREVNLISMVGSDTLEEAEAIAKLGPDMIVSEPSNRIGTLRSVGRDAEFVKQTLRKVKNINPNISVICGAGISSGRDVKELLRLGVDGTGASKAICEAKEPKSLLIEMVRALESVYEN
jgi:triosephosphate isomerase